MYKINRKKSLNNKAVIIIPYVVGVSLTLGGILSVPKYNQCDVTKTYHAHLFTKDINNVQINKWLPKESSFDNTKNNTFIPTTTVDIEALETLEKESLFDGLKNIDFINYQINRYRDYLKFYYEYEETHYKTDEDGNKTSYTVEYSGWSTNPRARGVTGKVKVIHTMYYGYKLVYDEDRFKLEKSTGVDDIRQIILEYPYISEYTNYEVSKTYRFSIRQLPYLNVEEITPFYTPTIENNPLDNPKNLEMNNKIYQKKKQL